MFLNFKRLLLEWSSQFCCCSPTEKRDHGFLSQPQADRTFQFFDHYLMESIELGDPKVHEFLRLLHCHTVMSEENSAGKCSVSESCFLDRYFHWNVRNVPLPITSFSLYLFVYWMFSKIWRDLKEKLGTVKRWGPR